jgi:hypothetical protein
MGYTIAITLVAFSNICNGIAITILAFRVHDLEK